MANDHQSNRNYVRYPFRLNFRYNPTSNENEVMQSLDNKHGSLPHYKKTEVKQSFQETRLKVSVVLFCLYVVNVLIPEIWFVLNITWLRCISVRIRFNLIPTDQASSIVLFLLCDTQLNQDLDRLNTWPTQKCVVQILRELLVFILYATCRHKYINNMDEHVAWYRFSVVWS